MNIHQWLEEKAGTYKPGEIGLLALDWWNGNRSVLVDTDLSGVLLGLTLHTKPEEIYRALLESTAFGTRKIIEDRKSTRLNSSHVAISYAVFCLKKKTTT